MDHRGVSIYKDSKKHYDTQRMLRKANPAAYLKYCCEYCYCVEEAFGNKGGGFFDAEKIAEQMSYLKYGSNVPKEERGFLNWDGKGGVKWIKDDNGPIRIIEHPHHVNNPGEHIPDLYVGGIDSIDKGEDDSVVGSDGSKFCILIKQRTLGLKGNKYVAQYIARPHDVRTAYENAMKLLVYYKCKANLEDSKTNIESHFRNKKMHHLLIDRPRVALTDKRYGRSKLKGTPTSIKMIMHGIELIQEYVLDFSDNILFYDMLVQLKDYSLEKKTKFDIIAAMQMCEIYDEDLEVPPQPKNEYKNWRGVGIYVDENGIKRRGVLPNQEQHASVQSTIDGMRGRQFDYVDSKTGEERLNDWNQTQGGRDRPNYY